MISDMTRISANGRLVVPAAIRSAMGLKGGERLTMTLDEHGLHVRTLRQSIADAQAIVRRRVKPERRLSEELIAERREEAKREARQAKRR